jgi:hypothetical protein
MSTPVDNSKRDFLKKTAYVVPVILTLKVAPALASPGSPQHPRHGDEGDGSTHGRRHGHHGHRNFFSRFKHAFRHLF